MKIFINLSNLKIGGGLQVAHSFLDEMKRNNEDKFIVVISKQMENILNLSSFSENFIFHKYSLVFSPFYSIFGVDKTLSELETIYSPDIVFTLFGPSFWTPKSLHIMGVANGWWYYPDSPAWDRVSFKDKIKKNVLNRLKVHQLKSQADHFIVETNDAKERVNKFLKISKDKIDVIGNTYNAVFNNIDLNVEKENSKFKVISVSAYYPHKNIEIIRDIANLLNTKNITDIHFYVTLPNTKYVELFSDVTNHVTNLGVMKISDLPNTYSLMDATLLPTLMETFSASYPEAMKMKLPIVTSDLSFARDICSDAALFVNSQDPNAILDSIMLLKNNRGIYESLVSKGLVRLSSFETAESRACKYIDLCKSLSNNN